MRIHGLRWHSAAIVLLVLGVAGSVLTARLIAQRASDQHRRDFDASAAQVASTLKLSIQHEQDLISDARGLIAVSPGLSNTDFGQWVKEARAFARYRELVQIAFLTVVPSARLEAFAGRARRDPPGPLSVSGEYAVTPRGSRPFHCLVVALVARPGAVLAPAGTDYCAPGTLNAQSLLGSRDSGHEAYSPFRVGAATLLGTQTPIYRGGGVPRTVAARRAAFLGWTGTVVEPQLVLDRALEGHPDTSVSMRFHNALSDTTFTSGVAPARRQSRALAISVGWTVRVSGAAPPAGLLATRDSTQMLLAGTLLSGLLAVLMYVLGTGRSRALRLVHEKTGELNHLALHDALTDLPNRALVMDRAEQMLARAARHPIGIAALFIDLDGFKDINDSFGHSAGDHVLKTVSERMLGVMRDQDTVGRLGGDEFVVLLESTSSEAPPQMVAERLIEVLRQPISLNRGHKSVAVSASIGVAIGGDQSADELLRDADLALYAAKNSGKDRYVLFEAKMHSDAETRNELKGDLRAAIEDDQFFLLYQPTLDLHTKAVTGVEALIRWQHPVRGVISPDQFIPLAEESGLIVPIGRWVLRTACAQAATWQRAGHHIGMSVNVSAVQLEKDGLEDDVRDALSYAGLDAGALTLEITETALMRDVAAATVRLSALKQLGARIAIDDFGTGYSSLAYLRQFPIDSLKIDRSFIAGIDDSNQSTAIIHTLVQLGKTLNIETLAEGIEDQDQLARLEREDVDHGQGFLFARPLDVRAVEAFFDRANRPHAAA